MCQNVASSMASSSSSSMVTISSIDQVSDTSESSASTTTPLLSRLRAPTKSDLTRKRTVCHNLHHKGKQTKKPSCSTYLKTVNPAQRVKDFLNQALTVSVDKLFCSVCREELSLKRSIVKNCIDSTKHAQSKEHAHEKESGDRDIAELKLCFMKCALVGKPFHSSSISIVLNWSQHVSELEPLSKGRPFS